MRLSLPPCARAATSLLMGSLLTIMTVAAPLPVQATTLQIAPDGGGAYPTIQAAITAAQTGDVIELLNGTFQGPGNRDLDYQGKAITIRSQSGHAVLCVIDCGGQPMTPHRGFLFQTAEGEGSVLENVRVESAYGDGEGGGVLCKGASPTLRGVEFADNDAGFGGALACLEGANPWIQECLFMGNLSDFGSGAACRASSPRFTDCRFADNLMAEIGGGLLCEQGSHPVIERCTFENNQAEMGAGMACRDDSNPTVFQSRFLQNAAHEAGAAWCANSSPVFTECVFAANTASDRAGAVHCVMASPRLVHCTLYGNQAPVGAGIFAWFDSAPAVEATTIAFAPQGEAVACADGGTATLSCSNLYGNAGGNWTGSIAGQGASAGNFSADPRFCDAAAGILHVWGDSPCLPGNHPDNGGCELTGAFGLGCTAVHIERTTWSGVKALYRGDPKGRSH